MKRGSGHLAPAKDHKNPGSVPCVELLLSWFTHYWMIILQGKLPWQWELLLPAFQSCFLSWLCSMLFSLSATQALAEPWQHSSWQLELLCRDWMLGRAGNFVLTPTKFGRVLWHLSNPGLTGEIQEESEVWNVTEPTVDKAKRFISSLPLH